jgi:hypothetical protein
MSGIHRLLSVPITARLSRRRTTRILTRLQIKSATRWERV